MRRTHILWLLLGLPGLAVAQVPALAPASVNFHIAHHADILQISSSSGQGLPEWYDWLRDRRQHLESSNWDVVEKH